MCVLTCMCVCLFVLMFMCATVWCFHLHTSRWFHTHQAANYLDLKLTWAHLEAMLHDTPYCGLYFLQEFAAQQKWHLSSELYKSLPYDKETVFSAPSIHEGHKSTGNVNASGNGVDKISSASELGTVPVIAAHFLRYKENESLVAARSNYTKKNKDNKRLMRLLMKISTAFPDQVSGYFPAVRFAGGWNS